MGRLVYFLLACLLVLCSESARCDFHVIDLEYVMLDYKDFAVVNPNAHNYLTYPDPPKESVNVNIFTNVLTFGYWDSTIESMTTDGQYRAIGLETRLGVRVTDELQLGYYHHSQHGIDRETLMPHFPVEDAVEIRLYLFRSKDTRQSLF